jgi:hypothetical protein
LSASVIVAAAPLGKVRARASRRFASSIRKRRRPAAQPSLSSILFQRSHSHSHSPRSAARPHHAPSTSSFSDPLTQNAPRPSASPQLRSLDGTAGSKPKPSIDHSDFNAREGLRRRSSPLSHVALAEMQASWAHSSFSPSGSFVAPPRPLRQSSARLATTNSTQAVPLRLRHGWILPSCATMGLRVGSGRAGSQ